MDERSEYTRRDVNLALLAIALAVAAGGVVRTDATHLFDFAIAGGYHNGLYIVRETLHPGFRLELKREPSNPFDADAVAVHFGEQRLGYIPRAANTPIARLLDRGEPLTAKVLQMIEIERVSDIPNNLVFTGFMSGDPIIRLTLYSSSAIINAG